MSKSGSNWLPVAAGVVAVAAIGAGVFFLSQREEVNLGKPKSTVEKRISSNSGNKQITSGSARKSVEASPEKKTEAPEKTTEAVKHVTPTFDLMRVEPSGDAVVAGRAEAGAIVALLSNGEVIGKGIANSAGEFAIVLEQPLKPGEHDVSLEAAAKGSENKIASEQHIAVVIPEEKGGEALVVLNETKGASKILQEPAAVAVQATKPVEVAKAEQPAAPEVNSAEENNKAPASAGQPALQTAQAKQSAPVIVAEVAKPAEQPTASNAEEPKQSLRVQAVEAEQGKVYVAGEGTPGSKVRVYVNDQLVGEARAQKTGRWLVEAKKSIPAGEVEVRADQVVATGGKVQARAQVTFKKEQEEVILRPVKLVAKGSASGSTGDVVTAGIGKLPSLIIRKGDNLWTISRRLYGKGIRYTTIYQANDRQIRNPDLIYPGQVFVLPEGDVNWKSQ